ncbi:hypothetical protein ACFYVR_16350 [Rhodococcus sp. NPDC003318]|uniref:hypothetical protein n=1 Tax=Rhodococcus sp. NPDC003318 TaxID=3364503 RepID=UPI0036C3F051
MDHVNRYDTRNTFWLVRAEYALALAIAVALFLCHVRDVNWVVAVALFLYIDVIGYFPGAVAHARSKTGEISTVYYVLYNTMHSMVTQAAVVGAWVYLLGFEWALLVIPIHLCGDRFLFGNFLKPFADPFEPKLIPEFKEFEERRALRGRARIPARQAPPPTVVPVP